MISFILVFLMLLYSNFYHVYTYHVGDVVKQDIYLDRRVLDQNATNQAIHKALENAPLVYKVDDTVIDQSIEMANLFFETIEELTTEYSDDSRVVEHVLTEVVKRSDVRFTAQELKKMLALPVADRKKIQEITLESLQIAYEPGILMSEVPDVLARLSERIHNKYSDIIYIDLIDTMLESSVRFNKTIDVAQTNAQKEHIKSEVPVQYVEKGTRVARAGDLLQNEQWSILKQANMITEPFSIHVLGLFFLHAICWLAMHLYFMMHKQSLRLYIMIQIVFCFILLISLWIPYYAAPYLLFPMLIGSLVSIETGIYIGTTLLVYLCVITGMPLADFLLYLIITLSFIGILGKIKQRTQIIRLGFYLAIFLAGGHYFVDIMMRKPVSLLGLYYFANALICAILSIGFMPMLESLFRILTPLKLLELSNPNKPLLKRLLLEAPGTYHHSILVGNLAETAAHDIGANSLLTRVAAYYHDIGKLTRPYYFKENQLSSENPHDHLPPTISAQYIKEHVTVGVQMLKKNRLPEEIIQVVASHHGTSLIKFFFHKEIERVGEGEVDAQTFTYPGPKPRSKEAVILMLADSVEAAVRSKEEIQADEIAPLIDKIVHQKIMEDQLSDSVVTFSELNQIKRSFGTVIDGIVHKRVEYPEVNVEALEKNIFEERMEGNNI